MSDNDMPDVNEDEDVVPGGGPKEGEDAVADGHPNPNPDAVHPDYLQTLAGEPKPATDVPVGTSKEEGSDEA
jgi:hypothetical protein